MNAIHFNLGGKERKLKHSINSCDFNRIKSIDSTRDSFRGIEV